MKKKATATYASQMGTIVSSKHVESCNSNVHKVELKDGSVATMWSDSQLIPIGTRVCVDVRNTDGKAFL